MSELQIEPAQNGHAPGHVPAAPAAATTKRRLGDVVTELGHATREQVEVAVAYSRERRVRIGEALIETGVIDSNQLAEALAQRNGLDYVDLSRYAIDHGAANLVNANEARRYCAIPIAFVNEQTILVATADPSNVIGLDDIALRTGYEVRQAISSPEDIDGLIGQLTRLDQSIAEDELEPEEEEVPDIADLRDSAADAPVVKLVRSVIADAVQRGASDIHFEPNGGEIRVRMRIDGVVIDSTTVPRRLAPGLISRIKIMAELDIAERRLPQDGRLGITIDDRHVDIRVATLPVRGGESVVMRILDKSRVVMTLGELGLEDADRDLLRRSLSRIHGAVLVTGPTGAGKSTTLYAALNEVNNPERTLISIEDPAEYELDGVKQVQVNVKAGLSFAAGLRSMIRCDPDVLMVGEVRDSETARTAIELALTGHLVLTTLHTNSAPMAPARLIEMGIEPFLVASGIECIVAQRLVRRLCDECRRPIEISPEQVAMNGFAPTTTGFVAYEPGGCVRCKDSGYRGRIGLYEVLAFDDQIRSLILRKGTADEIGAAARAAGMSTLRDDGLEKVRRGVTSIAEVLRVCGT